MVSVRGLAATPSGARPTGIVAVTLIAAVTAWAVLRAAGAHAAAAVMVAAGASTAIATVIRVTARRVPPMMSCFLPSRASGCSRSPAGAGTLPYVQTPGRAGWLRRTALPGDECAIPGRLPAGRPRAWSICGPDSADRDYSRRPRDQPPTTSGDV